MIQQGALEGKNRVDLKVIQVAMRTSPDRSDLLCSRIRRCLRLLQKLHQTLTASQLLAGCRIKVGSKHGECSHRTVLSECQLQRAGNLLHCLHLCVATNSRNRDTDVNGRALIRVEQIGLQEDLTIGNRNDVGRNVGRHVVCLGFNDRKPRH
ncbi:Uncharacterised protein [Chlamydia trachomatis]|nr:Uncharacterised protein [Chlamydia trachomatis]